jgi:galactokinase
MDQLIAVRAMRGHALLIDCRSLETTQIPLDTSRTALVVCDTRVKHDLASSEYNARRAECERGVEILSEVLPGLVALRDVSAADFAKYEDRLPEPFRRRCRHVITENVRTLSAAAHLRAGEMDEVGKLMFLSHASLRDDYEVSCAELDLLVEIASCIRGVAGARMIGGGFSGSTVNIVARESLDEFQETVIVEYEKALNYKPDVYVTSTSNCVKEIPAR